MLNYDHGDFNRCELSSNSAPRLHVRNTVYVPNVTGLRQSKSLILRAPHCDKRVCDNLKA